MQAGLSRSCSQLFLVAAGFICGPCSLWQRQAYAYTVQDIPGIVQQQNRDVQSSRYEAKAASEEVSVARARYFPKVEWTTTFTHLDDDLELDPEPTHIEKALPPPINKMLPKLAVDVDPSPIPIQKQNFWKSTLNATQPLYAGNRISSAYQAANKKAEEAEIEVLQVQDAQTQLALTRYFQVQAAVEAAKVFRDIEANLDNIKRLSDKLANTGVIPKFSVLQIQVAQADLKSKQEEVKAKENLARSSLRVALSLKSGDPLTLESPLLKVPLNQNVEVFQKTALEKRREFAIITSKQQQLDLLQSAQTGEMLPTVFAFGRYELIKKDLTVFDPTWAVGAGVNIPLTAGLSQFPERHRTQELKNKAQNIRDKATFDIPLQVENYYSEVRSAEGALASDDEGINQAKEANRLAVVRYGAGEGSTLEVLSTSNDLEKIHLKRLEHLESYNRNLINLYWSAGELDAYMKAYDDALKSKGNQSGAEKK